MVTHDMNIFLFKHFGHAVVLKTQLSVTLVLLANLNVWRGYSLIAR